MSCAGRHDLHATNRCRRDHRRSRHPRKPIEPEEQRQVRLVLAVMDRRKAELLLLRHSGLTYDELAALLKVNPNSVGTLVIRAQQAFRKEYIKRYGEPKDEH
jgi:DNA-directed RNA polymerase specialized sigma24 family protein